MLRVFQKQYSIRQKRMTRLIVDCGFRERFENG